jgi:hypothetical protein
MGRATLWVAFLGLLAAEGLAAAPCAPSPTTLCLNASRFEVEVSWRDSRGRTGVGQAVPITADTGYFWFFSEANIELVVKVLDARSVNQKYWVFFGALSNVEYDLTVTDTATGAVKTYHNPLGQFASVGDTGAFEGTVHAPPTSGTVTVDGTVAAPESLEQVQKFIDSAPATATSSPCPETTFGFLLNGCRFHIEVSWRDSRGRSGYGQPVPLTNDTGYFWFFSPANVELMVKVLDARAVNGKFWVFFGALSNVEYTVSVTDRITGSVRTYTNPSGAFASVGDTGAFLGGYSVVPVRDAVHGTTAELNQTGGTIVAHGADGTTFTLAIPPDALDGPLTITMTPVSRIDRLPFSGGLLAGVELEPEGLRLRVPATLTVDAAVSPTPPNHILTYAYARGGENLILYPGLDGEAVALPILHFSGYGAGSGSAGDAAAQGSETPAGPLEPYVQQYAGARARRFFNVITQEELYAETIEIFTNAYNNVVVTQLNKVKESCDKAELQLAMQTAFDYLRFIQLWGFGEDERMKAFTPLVFELADEILRACQQKAFDRCVSRNDPFQIVDMLYIARQLQLLGDEDPYLTTFIQDGLMESCLRFEIDFESKLVEEHHSDAGVTTTRMKYRAQHVPLRFNYGGNDFGRAIWEGSCTLLPVVVEIELPVPLAEAGCSLTIQPENGFFNVAAAWIAVMDDPTVSAVKVLYDPGNPTVNATLHCKDSDDIPFKVFQWSGEYTAWHHSEFSQGYGGALFGAKDWEQLRYGPGPSQNGEFFARKSYERDRVELDSVKTEETWFFLKHTPGAPMPDCPSLP